MRFGGWTVTSSSILSYLTAMNIRGTLRSSLRSFRQNEVTKNLTHLSQTYSRWTVGVVRGVVQRAMGETEVVVHEELVSIERKHVIVLCTFSIECMLALSSGKEEGQCGEGRAFGIENWG